MIVLFLGSKYMKQTFCNKKVYDLERSTEHNCSYLSLGKTKKNAPTNVKTKPTVFFLYLFYCVMDFITFIHWEVKVGGVADWS